MFKIALPVLALFGLSLLPGAAAALKRLAEAGFENIIATNQSGIARGLLDETTLERIHDRLRELLAADGAYIHAIYYCPYLDGDEAKVEQCFGTLKRRFHLHRSRYFGLRRTEAQVRWAAIGFNLLKAHRKLERLQAQPLAA